MTAEGSVGLPDPGRASNVNDVTALLRELKVRMGSPSFEAITAQVNRGRSASEVVGKTTVVDCFRTGRRRLDAELVAAVVRALHPDVGYVAQWRQALRVIEGTASAADQVRVFEALPMDVPQFTGREQLIDRFWRTIAGGERAGSTTVVTALQGMAGVGKTQLAVHLGHVLVLKGVVDKVLFVNLRGFYPDEAQPPASPAAVLDGFLRVMGVPGQSVPTKLSARIALFHKKLTGQRVLLVLDNASDEQQVLPLLPHVDGCVALVTSRRALSLPDAVQAEVELFTPQEAHRYLVTVTGEVAVREDPQAAARIIDRCGHLPLALAVVAGHILSKPAWTLSDHAEWLDERHASGRLHSGIEVALNASYRALPAHSQRLLRQLALHPGQSFDAYAAAALAGDGMETVNTLLGQLADVHLLQTTTPGRFALHDLVREFAAGRAVDEDRRAERRAALSRLLDQYLATAAEDMNRMDPAHTEYRPAVASSPVLASHHGQPGAWLDAEFNNLILTAELPDTQHDRPGYLLALSEVLYRYFIIRGHLDVGLSMHQHAVLAAQRSGDVPRHAHAVFRVAVTQSARSRYLEALDHLVVAEHLFIKCGDETGRLRTLVSSAVSAVRVGRTDQARQKLLTALEISGRIGDQRQRIAALSTLGTLNFETGLLDDAAHNFEEGLSLAQADRESHGEITIMANLAEVQIARGYFDNAQEHLIEAMRQARAAHNKILEAHILVFFGKLHAGRGEHTRARHSYQDAVSRFDDLEIRDGAIDARMGLGDVALRLQNAEGAIVEYLHAYELAAAEDVSDVMAQARAMTGLGKAYRQDGNLSAAREHFHRAKQLWARLNASALMTEVDAMLASAEDKPV
jgi:tetratricopeptide (TPR) repeat protein